MLWCRYIVSAEQHMTCYSIRNVAQLISEDKELAASFHRLPFFDMPTAPMKILFSMLPKSVLPSSWSVDGCQCGFNGSKISKDLGFVHQHKDLKQTIFAATRSCVAFGSVEGQWSWSTVLLLGCICVLIICVPLVLFVEVCLPRMHVLSP